MNVIDLDVYMNVLYIVCAMCMFCNYIYAGYTVFYNFFIIQPYLLRLRAHPAVVS
jgi:hypothetical protein